MERMKLILPELKELIEAGDMDELRELLEDFEPVEVAEVIEDLDDHQLGSFFAGLDAEKAVEILEELAAPDQARVVSTLGSERAAPLLDEMAPDVRADLFEELPEEVAKPLLARMSRAEAEDVRHLMRYDPDSAGGIMTTEFASASETMTAQEALDYLRERAKTLDTIYYLYVVDRRGKLVGVVSLKQLVLSDPGTPLAELMRQNPIAVHVEDNQEQVAREMAKYDFLALPVVDTVGSLRGIVTVDDAVDVIEEEATEDMHRMASMEAVEDEYLKTTFFTLIRKRAFWLIALLFAEAISGEVLKSYSYALQAVVALAYFVPMLTGTGGNAGSQTSTMIIRALATGEITLRDAFSVIKREIATGIFLGAVLGVLGFVRAFTGEGNVLLGVSLGLALIAVVTIATTLGTVLPLFFRRIKLDPAYMSGPFITTVIDITSLIVYFEIVKRILSLSRS